MMPCAGLLLCFLACNGCGAFAPTHGLHSTRSESLLAATDVDRFSLTLTKPLGIILEEIEEGKAAGVFVKQVSDSGSAAASAQSITGAKIKAVQGTDVSSSSFDDVMDLIVNTDESLEIEFEVNAATPESVVESKELEVGTSVTIRVLQGSGSPLAIEARVGDNLRQVLLDNGVEVYQGMKQKLGNCGGAGQCTFCAVDFLECEGWAERSEYEDKKLKKFQIARLACLNNIQGPATIQKTQR